MFPLPPLPLEYACALVTEEVEPVVVDPALEESLQTTIGGIEVVGDVGVEEDSIMCVCSYL